MVARDGTAPDQPDLIVRNAQVTTLRGDSGEAEALAVCGERSIAVGGEAEVMSLARAGARRINEYTAIWSRSSPAGSAASRHCRSPMSTAPWPKPSMRSPRCGPTG
jgi:hypothetical protein